MIVLNMLMVTSNYIFDKEYNMNDIIDEILYLNGEGLIDTDICLLLGIKYAQFRKDMKKMDYTSNTKSKDIYSYVYKNLEGIWFYVYMENNNKYFYEFLDKEELLKAIETEKWEQPMVL